MVINGYGLSNIAKGSLSPIGPIQFFFMNLTKKFCNNFLDQSDSNFPLSHLLNKSNGIKFFNGII